MRRTQRAASLLLFLSVSLLPEQRRGVAALAQTPIAATSAAASIADRFAQADAQRLNLTRGTAARADAAAVAARLAGERAWELYGRDDMTEAARWLERQLQLQAEHYGIWSAILDADFKRLELQAASKASLTEVAAWRALWITALEVVETAHLAEGRVVDTSSTRKTAETLTAMNSGLDYFISNAAFSAQLENRDIAGMLASRNSDRSREFAVATAAVEVARAATKLVPPAGQDADGPSRRLASLAKELEALGTVERTLGYFDQAEQHYWQALSARGSMPGTHPLRRLHETFALLGRLFRESGQLERAREAFEQALASIVRQPASTDSDATGRALAAIQDDSSAVLTDIGELLEGQGNFAGALLRYRAAEEAAVRVADIISREAASTPILAEFVRPMARAVLRQRTMVPLLQARLGEVNSSQLELQHLVEELAKLGESSVALAALTSRLGMVDLSLGETNRAVQSFTLALGYFDASHNVEGAIYSRLALATALSRLGRPVDASKHAEAAFGLTVGTGLNRWAARAAIVSVRMLLARGVEIDVDRRLEIVRRASSLLSAEDRAAGMVVQGLRQEQRHQTKAAIALYRQAIAQIEPLRAEPFSQDRFYDAESHYEPYERLIRLLLEDGQAAEAFRYTLMSRTQELRQAHDDALASARPELQELFKQERDLRAKVQSLSGAAPQPVRGSTAPDDAVAAKQTALGIAVEQWRAVTAAIASAEPAYSLFVQAPSLADVQAALGPDTALLVYVAPLDQALQIFVVTQQRTRVFRSPVAPAELWQRVADLRRQMGRREPGTDRLRGLYQALIAPLEAELQGIGRLAILPSRALHYVPFPALVRRAGSADRFLIEDKELVQLSGAGLGALQKAGRPARANRIFAALADPTNDLPQALDEVAEVRQLFPVARVFTRAEATKGALDDIVVGSSIFHFAGHAELDPLVPSASHLKLAPADASGLVTVNQIRALPLTGIELVTLSACEASLGQGAPRGIAITSLSDAFMMAGAKSVVGTLWEVADDGTRALMVEFYRHLTQGSCKGAALRAAQLSLLRGGKFSHPYYWAGFSLFGDWGDLSGSRTSCTPVRGQ